MAHTNFPLVIDTEATTFEKGNPFSKCNKLMCVGTYNPEVDYWYFDIEHSGLPYKDRLDDLKQNLNHPDINFLIGFNIKYDLHWIRRYIPHGISIPRVWDCQLAQFILNSQTTPYPSLNDCLAYHNLPQKSDIVKLEYWDKGIDTDQIPDNVLREYNKIDCELTYKLYLKQLPLLKGNQLRLFQLHCADLLVLQAMEFRGLMFNAKQSEIEAKATTVILDAVVSNLNSIIGRTDVNWNSPKQVSAILYGGTIPFPVRVPTERTLKNGTIKTGERNGQLDTVFPQLVKPMPGSENSYGFSTDENTLRSLTSTGKARELIQLLLKQSELDKLVGTYYNGLPNLIKQKDWELDTLHGQINQCVARTGRTSSSQPNLQNFDARLKPLFYSRFPNET